jgi:hypothetical protein
MTYDAITKDLITLYKPSKIQELTFLTKRTIGTL